MSLRYCSHCNDRFYRQQLKDIDGKLVLIKSDSKDDSGRAVLITTSAVAWMELCLTCLRRHNQLQAMCSSVVVLVDEG